MTGVEHEDAAASFDSLRPKLMRVTYRMLGSVARLPIEVPRAATQTPQTMRNGRRREIETSADGCPP